ncbi:MAG TPA: response regulator transcription factor [Flavipsychrobacter sp.]|nr:response regulator transcription factor [Flavipsychrobacter sp.]
METTLGKILLVDDEESIVEIISYNLKQQGYEIATASNGIEAITKAKAFNPDLILLDIMMPKKDGIETLKELRNMAAFANTAIIMLTAKSDEATEITGLQLGADDFIRKPIKTEVLLTRIQTALRRSKREEEQTILNFGNLEINKTHHTVTYNQQVIALAKKEFELLMLLASKPGRVFLRNEILDKVWGADVIVGDRTIDVHVRKIRQKVGIDLFTTIKGVGYKFEISEPS